MISEEENVREESDLALPKLVHDMWADVENAVSISIYKSL